MAPREQKQPHSDSSGRPVVERIDPTANVLSHVAAAVTRLDDMRSAEGRRHNDLAAAESRRVDEQAALRAEFAERYAAVESKRIDANALAESRRIDALLGAAANAVTLASTRAELTAGALAERVDTSAKTLAQSVVTAAEALRAQQQAGTESQNALIGAMRTSLEGRLGQLEQTGYLQKGQATRDDPMMVELVQEMKNLRQSRDTTGGEQRGGQQVYGYVAAALGLVIAAAAIIFR